MVGPDTCGHLWAGLTSDEEDELCARWIQLSTFYPFARWHPDATGTPLHEPWAMTGQYKEWAKNAINDRYQYLRHMYTCLYEASHSGTTCFDPLLFHYPADEQVYKDIEHSFIVGDALKVSPKLEAGNDTFMSYFPTGKWVSMQNYTDIVNVTGDGEWKLLDATLPTVNVHLRPGHMVLKQDNS